MLELRVVGFSDRATMENHKIVLGGAVLYSCSRIDPMVSVAMPADSNMWASVLTVRVHKGQTGVSKTTSTSCLFNREAAAGPSV